jgi:transcriptional regulator with GAF, ATPase, and Fis domain
MVADGLDRTRAYLSICPASWSRRDGSRDQSVLWWRDKENSSLPWGLAMNAYTDDFDFPDHFLPLLRPDGSLQSLEEIEQAAIDFAVQITGSVAEAARQLGLGRATVYRKLRKYSRPSSARALVRRP